MNRTSRRLLPFVTAMMGRVRPSRRHSNLLALWPSAGDLRQGLHRQPGACEQHVENPGINKYFGVLHLCEISDNVRGML